MGPVTAVSADSHPRTLAQWLAFIETLHPKSIALGLERIAAVAARMAMRITCPVITVAGTNGKGSTCAIAESIYRCAGYRTGLYASPHLLRFNERVRIAGKEAEDAALADAFAVVEAARDLGDGASTPLTYFEYTTLAALHLFAAARLDVLILEVGLGGRLDAVNLVDADVAVVTTIGIDHVDWLGATREAIGREKAGIFRKGRTAICGDSEPPHSLVDAAHAAGATLWRIGVDYRYAAQRMQWRYDGPGGARYGLPLPALRGAYQLANAATALAALDALRVRLPVAAGAVRDGLVQVELPGRFQVLPGRPAVVLDVAHNPQAAGVLSETLSTMGFFPRTLAVFGMLGDKDIDAVVRALAPRVDCWYIAPLPGPRGALAAQLATALTRAGVDAGAILAFDDIEQAFDAARSAAGETDRIAAFGSFLTVAAALAAAQRKR
ncbi:MAG TPA: bifunctional tetrahydrofolate synthase/dihydrofolate synthase [Casimicrobiaceae bacterium]|nr:bifunctional tetrahydrofolate synthase/dihydrofolate synthase [Casimicrobiaceae bacterium]